MLQRNFTPFTKATSNVLLRGAPALLKNSAVALLHTPVLVVGETVVELGTPSNNEDGSTAK